MAWSLVASKLWVYVYPAVHETLRLLQSSVNRGCGGGVSTGYVEKVHVPPMFVVHPGDANQRLPSASVRIILRVRDNEEVPVLNARHKWHPDTTAVSQLESTTRQRRC